MRRLVCYMFFLLCYAFEKLNANCHLHENYLIKDMSESIM